MDQNQKRPQLATIIPFLCTFLLFFLILPASRWPVLEWLKSQKNEPGGSSLRKPEIAGGPGSSSAWMQGTGDEPHAPGDPQNYELGFTPPPMDLSHLTGNWPLSKQSVSGYPARFDWRERQKVTGVQNQGDCGACYAFAALANFESRILIEENETWNFSENHAKECNSSKSSCGGGNFNMIANLYSQAGAAEESCDPYVEGFTGCSGGCPIEKTLLDWRIISGNIIPDTEMLKSYIYTYGPIYTTLFASFDDFPPYHGSEPLYYTGTESPNHAVLIVGWDDTLVHEGGRGAWIVKNSWGDYWGQAAGYGTKRGFFTIAYGSAGIGKYSSYVYSWQDYDPEGDLLFYDQDGWTHNMGREEGPTTAWGMAKFTPAADTTATRVEFWTNDVTTDIDIYLYDDFSEGRLRNLLGSREDESFGEAGYHSVPLPMSVPLKAGNDVFVVVKFTNQVSTYPVPIELSNTEGPETTYFSFDGSDGSWYDVSLTHKADVAIRLRTSNRPAPPAALQAVAISKAQINLSWIDSSANEDGFHIYRSMHGDDDWMLVASTEADAENFADMELAWTDNSPDEEEFKIDHSTSVADDRSVILKRKTNTDPYSDSEIDCSAVFDYRLRAFNSDGYSAYTPAATASFAGCLPAPDNLQASALSATQIQLSWMYSWAASDFHLERSSNGLENWQEVVLVDSEVKIALDKGLEPGTTYFYRVRAYRAEDEQYSPYSEEISAKTFSGSGSVFLPMLVQR